MTAPASPRPSRIAFLWLCRFLTSLILTVAVQAAPKWEPISKEELAEQTPKVDPEAGAEIILRDVEMDHSSWESAEDTYYIRAKIFSQRGIEDFSKIELPYDDETAIHAISGRTTKSDGTTFELNSKDIYDRELIKTGNIRVKVKSFALPGLEPGAIVEYRYTVTQAKFSSFIPMFFQATLPARLVRFKLRLYQFSYEIGRRYDVRTLSFNCPQQKLKPDTNGYFLFEMANLPAAKEEIFQPPTINTDSAVLVYYALKTDNVPPPKFWGQFSDELQDTLDRSAKPTKIIQAALAGILNPSDSDNDKLRKIHDFCRTKIVNRYSDTSGITDKQRSKLKENKTATDTLQAGSGTHQDLNTLFAALARAAGFEVRLAACNDRSRMFFSPTLTEASFGMPDRAIAVRSGEKWLYADPGALYLPFGVLSWENTETAGLISDPKGKAEPLFIAGEPAEANCLTRKATLKLNNDGSLEGDVTELYTGYREARLKHTLDAKTTTERETYIREDLQEYQKLAEISDIVIENAADPVKPLKIAYHLRIPEFADRTGTRLFFQPAVFQKGAQPFFKAATRRNAIIFNYRYTTQDEIRITPPEGFTLEQASAPENINLGRLGEYTTAISISKKTGSLIYKRKFSLSGLMFQATDYHALKAAFEHIHKNDNHTLTLKQIDPPSANTTPAALSAEPESKPQ